MRKGFCQSGNVITNDSQYLLSFLQKGPKNSLDWSSSNSCAPISEGGLLVLIVDEEEVIEESSDEEVEVWEIPHKEFEENIIDTQYSSPEV